MKYYHKKEDKEWLEHYFILDDNGTMTSWVNYGDNGDFEYSGWVRLDNDREGEVAKDSEELTKEEFEKRLFISLL